MIQLNCRHFIYTNVKLIQWMWIYNTYKKNVGDRYDKYTEVG